MGGKRDKEGRGYRAGEEEGNEHGQLFSFKWVSLVRLVGQDGWMAFPYMDGRRRIIYMDGWHFHIGLPFQCFGASPHVSLPMCR